MPNTQAVQTNHEYRNTTLATLVESPTNPENAPMKRLSENWQPLLVRPLEESKFEVVIGARRWKAPRLAELESLPVRVVKLTDADAARRD
jgi:ParB family transcriptional regulator, chromosome partitioning protein